MICLGISVIFQILRAIVQTDFSEGLSLQNEENGSGLSNDELNNLEVKTYGSLSDALSTESTQENLQNNVCSICLSEYQHDELIFIIPGCRHLFHENCIKDWLRTLAVCPYCRRNVRSDPGHSNLVSESTEQDLAQDIDSGETNNPIRQALINHHEQLQVPSLTVGLNKEATTLEMPQLNLNVHQNQSQQKSGEI